MSSNKGQESSLKKLKLNLLDAATLLYLAHLANNNPDIGYEDYEQPISKMRSQLNESAIRLKIEQVESMLWSANLLDEKGKFKSPLNETFDQFVTRILNTNGCEGQLSFDKKYNWIMNKKRA